METWEGGGAIDRLGLCLGNISAQALDAIRNHANPSFFSPAVESLTVVEDLVLFHV
jgi:hypothetical protein